MEQDANDKSAENNEQNKRVNPPKIRLTPPTSTSTSIPRPKIKLQTTSASPATGSNPKKETSRVNLPPEAIRTPDTVSVPPVSAPIPDAIHSPASDQAPKTIRIKRPGTSVLKPPTIDNPKKQTSRVDINTAMAENETASAPRTIKLKRPGTTILEKAEPPPEMTTQFKIEDAKKSETSRIELPPEASVEVPRRRKTVQIKRSGAGGGGGSATPSTRMVLNTKSVSAVSIDEPDIVIKAEESTVIFSLVSLVATIVTMIVLYVLAAQTVLPSLPWAGKL